ncbi:hypothetical protein AKJ37_01160 [candidate division MSBL1 archaeon SCGC-AAA259I09]|uniref:Response regulatory domain-containing protein n=2 Tax=candidate division MSBL1 TaxID=215777 RepID=A0A133UVE6_9EURY|nr:hypothetical protein AKJ36_02170 [candidate division MSBL1 archaeon SCGC-AAA259I07]KXA98164.1 hypothetical protein AKJ37_01160 [candidate division MSBL1 archaeon SCGC-AAA259I09]
MKILLIDDESRFLKLSKIKWERKGDAKVDTTTSPEKALEKIDRNDYDVIVADYKMPNLNGLEILEEIRGRGCKTPFVILTAKGGEEIAMEALNLKADRYIKKTAAPEKQYEMIIETIFEKPISL